jgi:trehalose synthase
MSAGKAIVASCAGQIEEVLKHNHTGLLVESGDRNELGLAIKRLLKDPALRKQLGENARRQAVERHSWDNYITRLEQIYQGVL